MNTEESKLSIIIPVYNENKTLLTLVKKLEETVLPNNFNKEIIIVDDGSKDGTRDVVQSLHGKHVTVLKEKNEGKGSALREGLKHATGNYVVVQDADLEYEPNDLAKMLEYMLNNNLRVLYGSRTRSMPTVKSSGFIFYAGGMSLSWIANILFNQRLTDEATCYKMFKTEFIKSFPLRCMKFEFCPEVTGYAALYGERIKEIPIMYYPRSVEEGKKIRLKDWFHAVWTLLRVRFDFSVGKNVNEKISERHQSFGEGKRSFLDMLIFNLRFHKIIPHIPAYCDTVADFGSGFRADSLRYLLEKKYMKRGIGLDLSITDEKFENITMFVEDFERGVKNLSENSVDCVLSLAILEHLYNPKLYLQDIYKSLKPGGVLLLTTPSPHSKPVLEFLSRQLKLIDRKEIDDHKHYFSLSELETLAKEVGFSNFKASYFELGMNDFLLAKK